MSSEPKTRPTSASVDDFIASVDHPGRREDAYEVIAMLREVTGKEPEMWGPSIIGFGRYHYDDPKGKPQEWPMIGLSPRKANLVVYLASGWQEQRDLVQRLGKHKDGVSCLYLNSLAQVDREALRGLMVWSMETTRSRHRTS